MRDHTVIVGYGVKGRSAAATLLSNGYPAERIVVVDPNAQSVEDANEAGLVGVLVDATRSDTLRRAGVPAAAQLLISTARDDPYVLATLSMPPHEASGGWVPSPRKLSAASARIATGR